MGGRLNYLFVIGVVMAVIIGGLAWMVTSQKSNKLLPGNRMEATPPDPVESVSRVNSGPLNSEQSKNNGNSGEVSVDKEEKPVGKAGNGKGVMEPKELGSDPSKVPPHLDYGRVEPISGTASHQAAATLDALKSGDHPERIALFSPPKPFDRQAFLADPAGYAKIAEPGRAFQSAKPGPGVGTLRAIWRSVFQYQTGRESYASPAYSA